MSKQFFLLLFFLMFHLIFLINLQFTAWPEMLAYPYLRNNDFLIYKDMIHPYPPLLTMGLSWMYGLFGYDVWVLKVSAWIIILASSLLVFFTTWEITQKYAYAVTTLGFYVLFQPFLEGNMLWFDIAIVPLILLGLLFLLKEKLFLSGLFLATAVLTKQTAGIYFIFALLYLLFIKKISINQLKSIFYGPIIFGIPFLIRLFQENALEDFVNWVFIYPLTKWGDIIGYVQMELSVSDWRIILLLFAPLVLIIFNLRILKNKAFQILFLFLIGSLISIYPRFSFFHFQASLAILVIIYGYLLSKIRISRMPIVLCLLFLAVIFITIHRPALNLNWQKETRFYNKQDLELAKVISGNVGEDRQIYLFGLHSNLYVLSNTLPPKRWTDNFSWYLEIPGVQEEILSRWSQNPPGKIFWRTPSKGNWFDLGVYQPQIIVRWIEDNYTKKEEVLPGIWLWESKMSDFALQ